MSALARCRTGSAPPLGRADMAAAKPADNVRPIVIKRVKKVAGGHHGGAWKVAYADFVTAMMAFFMLLWLLSNPDKQRLKGLAQYFSPAPPTVAAGSGGQGVSSESVGRKTSAPAAASVTSGAPAASAATGGGTATIPDASQRVVAAELHLALDNPHGETRGQNNVSLKEDREGLRVTLMDSDRQSMFRANTAELNPFARQLLAKVADKLAGSTAQIAIEGHTDGSGGQSEANWRLSGDRALAARTALIAAGLPSGRIAEVVALGATQPVYPDQPSRPENRRIAIVLKAQASALPSDTSFRF